MQNLSNRLVRRRLFGAWVSTVISISLVLLLVGVASILLLNARSVSDYFKENLQVSVLMKQDVTEEQALAYQSSLAGVPGVKATTFISREQGIEEMAQMLGRDFLDVFSTAPVPVSIDVNLEAAYVSPDSLEVVKAALSASPLVDEVVYQTSLVEALNANLQKIGLVLGVLILLLLFISFVLIGNMVRLNVFSRRFTIHTMQLVGATRGFIRAPFIGQSALQGLFAALVAILLLVAGLYILRKEFVQLFEIFRLDTLLATMGIVIVSGVLICVVSTWIVVGRLVRFDRDQLYAI
ncbi:MAG: permease-like cell division protein FtsX [Bacteroidales bacterium]|nr:permease-like cell division protein FtsX [Bacteroidales bacterium]